MEKSLQIDGYLTLPDLSLDLVEDLERLAPFGAGNPPVVLATHNLKLIGYVAVGRTDEHLQLTIEDELGHSLRSIWWQGAGYPLPETSFDLAYSVRASTYRGQRDVQVEWIDYRLPEAEKISITTKKTGVEVIDYRAETDPIARLDEIRADEEVQIWGEANPTSGVKCFDRDSLSTCPIFVIWTIPPGPLEIRAVLQKVDPRKVYLFGISPDMDKPEAFLKRLLGLLKYRIKSSHGDTSLSSLAAATAQKISTVKMGLEWLEARGHVHVLSLQDNLIQVEAGTGEIKKAHVSIASTLNLALAESAAFRRYYLKADKDRLVLIE